jgi:hypothetical protein
MYDERNDRTMSRQSSSPQDEGYSENEESGSGQFQMDPDDHHQYETMRHPSITQQEDYIKMIPALANVATIHRPAVPSHYDVPPLRKRTSESPVSSSASPSNYENSGPLPTIQEAPKGKERTEVYENFPAARKREEDFTHYRPSYENADISRPQRTGEVYQNIKLIDEEPQQPFRSRARSMEKGQYTPPRRGSENLHLHCAQRVSPSSISPPVPPRIPVTSNDGTTDL